MLLIFFLLGCQVSAMNLLTRAFGQRSVEHRDRGEKVVAPVESEEIYKKYLPGCSIAEGRARGATLVFVARPADESFDAKKRAFEEIQGVFGMICDLVTPEHRAFTWLSNAGRILIVFEGESYKELLVRILHFWNIFLKGPVPFLKSVYAVLIAGEVEYATEIERATREKCSFIGICGAQVGDVVRASEVIAALPDDDNRLLLAPSFVSHFSFAMDRLEEISYDMSRYKVLPVVAFSRSMRIASD
jgi:hypothetical protein